MARFQQWVFQVVRRGQGAAGGLTGVPGPAWRVARPADPTQPLWLVPAYQRQRRSGDRVVPR